jgi:hypothetical protein
MLLWLHGFLAHAGLLYRCSTCQHQPSVRSGGNSSTEGISTVDNMSNVEMRRDLSALQSSVSAMSSSIDQLAQQLSGIASRFPSSPPILDVSSSKSGPPTYVDVVSASFVKAAVSEAIREHQQISANEVCIAVYGFPEEG